jgi:hypothetical protein
LGIAVRSGSSHFDLALPGIQGGGLLKEKETEITSGQRLVPCTGSFGAQKINKKTLSTFINLKRDPAFAANHVSRCSMCAINAAKWA